MSDDAIKAAAEMREAAAKLVEESHNKPNTIPYKWNSIVTQGSLDLLASAIRRIPLTASPPADPRDESLKIAREALKDIYRRAGPHGEHNMICHQASAALSAIAAILGGKP